MFLNDQQVTRLLRTQNGRPNVQAYVALVEVGAIKRVRCMGPDGWVEEEIAAAR